MADFFPGDEEICFACHLMQECTDAGKLPPCLGVIEPVQQPITQQGRLEDSAQISALISKLEDVVASNGNVASVVTELKYAAQKLLPC